MEKKHVLLIGDHVPYVRYAKDLGLDVCMSIYTRNLDSLHADRERGGLDQRIRRLETMLERLPLTLDQD